MYNKMLYIWHFYIKTSHIKNNFYLFFCNNAFCYLIIIKLKLKDTIFTKKYIFAICFLFLLHFYLI